MDDDSGRGLLNTILSILKKPHLQKESDLAHEINDLMDEGQAMGLITDEESDMVHGVLDLKETTTSSIMIPRTDISSAPIDATLGELIKLVTDCGHTRIPIYQENIDEIIGLLHAKDLLRLLGEDPNAKIPPDILRAPYFVPRNKKAIELLRELKAKKSHLAIVTDEYGGTAGIITIEDILEEIVGEIMDEHDRDQPLISVIDQGSIIVDARLEVEKLEDYFKMKLPEGEFESVGGFIIHILGKIPKKGEKVFFQDLEMTIQSADERKIDSILITRKPPTEPAFIENNKY